MASSDSNKESVARLYDAFRAGDTQALSELIVDDYKQHNPLVADGLQALKAFLAQFGSVDVDVHRVIAEGDFVAVHAHYKTLNSAAVDIFRFNALCVRLLCDRFSVSTGRGTWDGEGP
jgi:predicted SnoaL-like aldol condensation-catalyzing enzyme